MTRFALPQLKRVCLVAFAVLTVCVGFTFLESHYSEQITFVKSPPSQTEIGALICDDVEDSNDCSTEAHFLHNAVVVHFSFPSLGFTVQYSTTKTVKQVYTKVYLLHRQLLV
jgi:hypothetical protein